MKAALFANGVRERILHETGGRQEVFDYFDFVVDMSRLMKPWESQAGYEDFVQHEMKLHSIGELRELEVFLRNTKIKYALLVGADYAKHLTEVTQILRENRARWGYLYNRGDFRSFITFGLGYRLRLMLKSVRNSLQLDPCAYARHYFSNFFHPGKFVGVSLLTRKVKINYRDYYFLQDAPAPPDHDRDYSVFLDQSPPMYDREYYQNTEVVEEYYRHLNEYLSHVSATYSTDIVVCLHPNAPEKLRTYFDPAFRVVRNATASYAKHAKLLVTHYSLAVSFGIMLRKPIVCVSFSDAYPPKCQESVVRFSEILNTSLHQWPDPYGHNSYEIPKRTDNKKLMRVLAPVVEEQVLIDVVKREIDQELERVG